MHLDWESLYYGKVTKKEVAEAVQDTEWQALREMIKGQPLETKYDYLTAYQRKQFKNLDSMTNHELRMVEVRLTNYVTALSRGGLIKPMDYRGAR